MSESDTPSDPRFRIPRGSSDEEIDSDLASVASSEGTRDEPPTQNAAPSRRAAISAATGVLRTGLAHKASQAEGKSADVDNYDADNDDEDLDDDALALVTRAATGRDPREREALKKARQVMSAGAEPSHPVAAAGSGTQADMMARMLQTLSGNNAKAPVAGLATLKKKVARLSAQGKKPLPVPLAEPVAGRINRAAAYDQTKELVTEKWADIVQRNRKAKTLTFPMNGPGEVKRNTGDVAVRFRAGNEYEREIDQMLKEAGVINDEQVVRAEDEAVRDQLGVSKVSKEELLERRKELAKMRSLMFHYEHKMKRIKKIKSRKYRKLMKKEKEKLKQMGDPDDSEDELIHAERRRAEERMTLRHKNTSKWVRRQLARGEARRNPETRAAIEEQLQLHQDLKKRQEREVANSDEESESEDSSADQASDGELDGKLDNMRKDLASDEEGEAQKPKKKKKGLMGMRFMEAAQEKQRKEALALLNEMGDDGSEEEEFEHDGDILGRQSFSGTSAKEESGRRKMKNRKSNSANAEVLSDDELVISEEERDEANEVKRRVLREYESSGTAKPSDGPGGMSVRAKEALLKAGEAKAGFTTALDGKLKVEVDNPWLNGSAGGEKRQTEKGNVKVAVVVPSKKGNRVAHSSSQSEEQAQGDESNPWLRAEGPHKDQSRTNGKSKSAQTDKFDLKRQKNKKRTDKEKELAEVSVIRVGGSKDAKYSTGRERRVQFAVGEADGQGRKEEEKHETPVPSEKKNATGNETAQDNLPNTRKRKRQQIIGEDEDDEGDMARMSLVAQAFAGIGGADEADFQAAKDAEIARSLPSAKDIGAEVLPGWGNWDGAGMSRRAKKEREESTFARAARERLEAARAKAVASRKDGKLKHVILDERRIKKAAELTLAAVPFPFTTAQQWQRELATPVCRELMSDAGFSNSVEGRVKKKLGVAIEPLRHGGLQDRRKRRKLEEREKRKEEEKKAKESEKRRKGKKGVIELRKERAGQRVAARKALMS